MGRTPDRSRRHAVLDALRAAPGPLGVAELSDRLGVHANTVRFHLDALVADGAVESTVEPPAGRGRPRTVYAPRPGMDRGGERGYQLLARILLGHLAAAGPEAHDDARRAGHTWGRFLVDRTAPHHRPTAAEATARLSTLLAGLGFQPEPSDATPAPEAIRLRHCPFLELAEESATLVCSVHLGLMRGALAELDAPVRVARLEPFATPDTCLARLEPAAAA
ncbi:helix-turn-helix transcriptional regulator [Streptantibioticus cattleyicolor]|uniref:Transcriptional regulator n=1 Tax=Streptantibioticus cattleyicolor (strain ATCC 35852 / DSM 46488 / JCM 4925 / NBRC 14057 / NRRL 8057) TaxID=1003195 RepID=F8JJ08_STREN|nr:helix-turn-helix domain-containing protein [Streptantibioticus cattleyicolor]AEW98899.1 transcriptional regulator [Streptantibioticus cattleyicolor NRRL 8057 = DSM 46488]CCB72054.1 Transcriptional regulator [Streptantibioticus cattleyicolor NRRL 8057 = DSM 46488]